MGVYTGTWYQGTGSRSSINIHHSVGALYQYLLPGTMPGSMYMQEVFFLKRRSEQRYV